MDGKLEREEEEEEKEWCCKVPYLHYTVLSTYISAFNTFLNIVYFPLNMPIITHGLNRQ